VLLLECLFRYRLGPETFGYTLVQLTPAVYYRHSRLLAIGFEVSLCLYCVIIIIIIIIIVVVVAASSSTSSK
jgi:hypothetical protein